MAVGLLVRRDRHPNPVVLALPQRLSLLLAHADDGVRHAVDADLLSDRVGALEQVVFHVGPDDGDVGAMRFFGLREAAALGDVHVRELRHQRGVAAHLGAGAGLVSDDHGPGGGLAGADRRAGAAAPLHGAVLLQAQHLAPRVAEVVVVAGDEGRHLVDREDVRAEAMDPSKVSTERSLLAHKEASESCSASILLMAMGLYEECTARCGSKVHLREVSNGVC